MEARTVNNLPPAGTHDDAVRCGPIHSLEPLCPRTVANCARVSLLKRKEEEKMLITKSLLTRGA